MQVFPEVKISETEIDIVKESFSNPAVRKYLQLLAFNTGVSLLANPPGDPEGDTKYMRSVAGAHAQLFLLEELLKLGNSAQS